MNLAQVNQEWWRAAQAERAARTVGQRFSKRAAAATSWVITNLPDMVEPGGAPDPWAVTAALRLRDLGMPVTADTVRRSRDAYEQHLRDRGFLADGELRNPFIDWRPTGAAT
jgi:hypothetical protein